MPLLCVLFLWTSPASAVGTPAGTVVDNRATITYTAEDADRSVHSNIASFTVDELLDVTLSWQDGDSVPVEPGEAKAILRFLLTNTGNGEEAFELEADNDTAAENRFGPENVRIVLDSDHDGLYNAVGDRLYGDENRPILAGDQSQAIFVLSDIPESTEDGESGTVRLGAAAVTGSGEPGTAFTPDREGAPIAVVGASGGRTSAEGTYLAARTNVVLSKTVLVSDPNGGEEPMSGATLTYAIEVAVKGSGTVRDLRIDDPIPAHTTYVAGSLRLVDGENETELTDADDGDAGALIEAPAGSGNYKITVDLGDQEAAIQTIIFQATID